MPRYNRFHLFIVVGDVRLDVSRVVGIRHVNDEHHGFVYDAAKSVGVTAQPHHRFVARFVPIAKTIQPESIQWKQVTMRFASLHYDGQFFQRYQLSFPTSCSARPVAADAVVAGIPIGD